MSSVAEGAWSLCSIIYLVIDSMGAAPAATIRARRASPRALSCLDARSPHPGLSSTRAETTNWPRRNLPICGRALARPRSPQRGVSRGKCGPRVTGERDSTAPWRVHRGATATHARTVHTVAPHHGAHGNVTCPDTPTEQAIRQNHTTGTVFVKCCECECDRWDVLR